MSDLLKEAIADAKAVRETALANAKMALEEAFTPQLQSMLSAKLREDEFEDEEEMTDEVPVDDEMTDEVPVEGDYSEQDEFSDEEEVPVDDEFSDEEEIPMEVDEVPGEEEMPMDDEIPGEEDELDLEAIIRELESELGDEDEIEEQEGPVSGYDKTAPADRDGLAEQEEDEEDDEFEVDESLFREEDEEDDEEEVTEQDDAYDKNAPADRDGLAEELKEYKAAVRFLKDKLHEVNILNAKLLFTNKLFKEFALTNDQKMRVVETFDRALTTREIKIVYSTLAESYKSGSIKRKTRIKESASSKSGSTKPSRQSRKVITEEAQVANRFKKLAGIIK